MPITAQDFRKLALSFVGAIESEHMNHPDFRLHGKIFASLGYPDECWGMVKLTPEQQAEFLKRDPAAFKPCKGAWGLRGATNVYLAVARKSVLQAALKAAAQNIADAIALKMKGRLAALRRSDGH
jgi:hypothetical protein